MEFMTLAEVTTTGAGLGQTLMDAAITCAVLMAIYALKALASYFKVKASDTKLNFMSNAAWNAVTSLEGEADKIRSANNGEIPREDAVALQQRAVANIVSYAKANGLKIGSALAQEFLVNIVESIVKQKKEVGVLKAAKT